MTKQQRRKEVLEMRKGLEQFPIWKGVGFMVLSGLIFGGLLVVLDAYLG